MNFNAVKEQSIMLYEKLHETHVGYYKHWLNNILFTWRW